MRPSPLSRAGRAAAARRPADLFPMPHHRADRRRRSHSPGLERLEARAVPATITVTSLGDSGPGTLRDAIMQADMTPARDTIDFAPAVTGAIVLQSALPALATDMDLIGPGASVLTVERADEAGVPFFRIFDVEANATVSISGLTIAHGHASTTETLPGAPGIPGGPFTHEVGTGGGGVFNRGRLTLSNDVLSDNQSGPRLILSNQALNNNQSVSGLSLDTSQVQDGGGVFNVGTLMMSESILSGNSTVGNGGGIGNAGTATVTDSTILGNTAGDSGGIGNSGTMTVTGCTIRGNSGTTSVTGGIGNSGMLTVNASIISGNSGQVEGGGITNGGMMTITDSTINGNSAAVRGGGISNSGAMIVAESTISNNSAPGTGESDPFNNGGGIYNLGTMNVTNSTISGNSTFLRGGGIGNAGTLTVVASTISGNSASNGGGIDSLASEGTNLPTSLTILDDLFDGSRGGSLVVSSGTFRSLGHNLFSDAPAVALDPTDQVNTDPLLGPLADNGGPTQTQALLPGSPAIDAGVLVPGVTTDQRGVPRPQGPAPDIGAFEVVMMAPPKVVSLHRMGFHAQPTRLILTFSAPMNPTSAQNLANYRLVRLRGLHHVGRPISLTSATYNPAAGVVTLVPSHRLPLTNRYQLTVVGTPPNGLTDTSGTYLDGAGTGRPGSDYVAVIDRSALVVPGVGLDPSPHRPRESAGRANAHQRRG